MALLFATHNILLLLVLLSVPKAESFVMPNTVDNAQAYGGGTNINATYHATYQKARAAVIVLDAGRNQHKLDVIAAFLESWITRALLGKMPLFLVLIIYSRGKGWGGEDRACGTLDATN